MRTLKFRCVEIDETHYWSFDDKPADLKIYGVYMFLEGSATHLCSLTPSSWMEWIDHVAVTDDDEWRDMFSIEYGGSYDDSFYGQFIDVETTKLKVSLPHVIEIEEKDSILHPHDDPDLEKAWEDAREYFQGNYPQFP